MKNALLLASILLGFGHSPAQTIINRRDDNDGDRKEYRTKKDLEYRVDFPNDRDHKVSIQVDNSNVRIEGHDGDEVIIRAVGLQAPPERARGLKPLYYSAEDNSGTGLSVSQEGKTLSIVKASRQDGRYTIRLPRKVAVEFEQVNWQGNNLLITNLEGDLEVKTNNADIEIRNVTGPLVASTTSGNIIVTYADVEQSKPSSISNISGVVDVTLPADTRADLKMKSITGEIYSDLDLSLNQGKGSMRRVGGGHTVEGSLNGGGVEISLHTISSDIYVRKPK